VQDVMTPLGQCFMLDKSLRLTFQSMLAIYKSGFTRVPIFEEDRQVRNSIPPISPESLKDPNNYLVRIQQLI